MTHNVHTCSKANCKHTMSNRNKNYANKLLRKDQHTHNLKKFQSLQWQSGKHLQSTVVAKCRCDGSTTKLMRMKTMNCHQSNDENTATLHSVTKSTYPSVLCRCWLDDRKGSWTINSPCSINTFARTISSELIVFLFLVFPNFLSLCHALD